MDQIVMEDKEKENAENNRGKNLEVRGEKVKMLGLY